jgi:hypothetical protein
MAKGEETLQCMTQSEMIASYLFKVKNLIKQLKSNHVSLAYCNAIFKLG